MRCSLLVAALFLIVSNVTSASPDPLVVHEWGTFTSLQDETGRTIGGINTDDEPLPNFVHDLLRGRTDASEGSIFSKGLPGGSRSEITMRLETPVIYFHRPHGSAPQAVDVSVQFLGGLLSQFYPDATTNVDQSDLFPTIDVKTLGMLRWSGIRVGTNVAGPKTDSHVWLAPRNVDADDVTASSGESERYLFYRGVGHIDAPILAKRGGPDLTFEIPERYRMVNSVNWRIAKLWLAKFDSDGSCHAVDLGPLDEAGALAATIPSAQTQHHMDLQQLRTSMKQALVYAGLFDDEADAMLSTWEKSYFKSGGLRLFYLVPRDWTDRFLPLKLSVDAKIDRVMMGRLELVSPEQRNALHQIAGMQSISTQMKPAWDAYTSMGRFKNALMLDAQSRRPAAGLRQFINLYGLQ